MGQKLSYIEEASDQVGLETLDSISRANRFNEWMFRTISKHTSGEILEIGSGIGNISSFFVKEGYSITLSDLRSEYCEILEKQFNSNKNYKGVYQIDIIDKDFDSKQSHLLGKFDTVFALNIIEHVDDDDYAIKNCLKLLAENGRLIILVPAFNFLFNSFDKGLGHYRRYSKKSLERLFVHNNLKIVNSRYFNSAGVFGWWLSGNVLKNKTIPSGQMKLYNSLVWAFKIADKIMNSFLGLSIIVTGEKSNSIPKKYTD